MIDSKNSPGNTLDNNASPIRPDGRIQCRHGQVISRKLCRSGANSGKYFYSCFKDRKDPLNCKFFMWNKDVEDIATNVSPGSYSPRWQPSDSSVAESSPQYRELLSTPSVSKKRRRDTVLPTPVKSPTGNSEAESKDLEALHFPASKRAKVECQTYRENVPTRDAQENPFIPLTPDSISSSIFATPSSKGLSSDTHDYLYKSLHVFGNLIEEYKRVECQKVAAEKAGDAKAERVAELEKQVAQLKELNESLQKQVEIYRGMLV